MACQSQSPAWPSTSAQHNGRAGLQRDFSCSKTGYVCNRGAWRRLSPRASRLPIAVVIASFIGAAVLAARQHTRTPTIDLRLRSKPAFDSHGSTAETG
jgi:hypothetical protein